MQQLLSMHVSSRSLWQACPAKTQNKPNPAMKREAHSATAFILGVSPPTAFIQPQEIAAKRTAPIPGTRNLSPMLKLMR
jgi:hypothetical protein